MHRRTFLLASGGVAFTGGLSGCLDVDDGTNTTKSQENDPTPTLGSAAIENLRISVEAPGDVTIRDPLEVTVSVANEGAKAHTVPLDISVEGVDPSTPPERTRVSLSVDAHDSETTSIEVETDYQHVEAGNLVLGDNRWTVAVGDALKRSGTFELLDGPVPWYQPDDEKLCAVCNMITEPYGGWNAQASITDGSRIEFCSLGCAVEYWANPNDHDASSEAYQNEFNYADQDDLVSMWAPAFTDVDTNPDDGSSAVHPGWEHLIDMREGYFVLDPHTFRKYTTPMSGGSPVCFKRFDDAIQYCEDDEELSEDDIVALDELAESDAGLLYRGRYHEGADQ